jgi:hypothetical protein
MVEKVTAETYIATQDEYIKQLKEQIELLKENANYYRTILKQEIQISSLNLQEFYDFSCLLGEMVTTQLQDDLKANMSVMAKTKFEEIIEAIGERTQLMKNVLERQSELLKTIEGYDTYYKKQN